MICILLRRKYLGDDGYLILSFIGHCDLGMRFFALHAYTRMIGYVCLPECPVEARIEEVHAVPQLICT
jgi:hypothetical protein